MKKIFATLLDLTGVRPVLVGYHKCRLRAAQALMKRFGSDTEMPVWCSERFVRHQRALLRLGFLAVREFTFAQQSVSGPGRFHQFRRLMRARFSDDYWSCAAQGNRMVVTAPASQFGDWERFLAEYDHQTDCG